MLEAMGIDTGIDLDQLIAAREVVEPAARRDAPRHDPEAGLPKGFQPAMGAVA